LRIQNCPLDESIRAEEKTGVCPSTVRYVNVYPCQFSNHSSKVSAFVGGEESGHVFGECEPCPRPSNNSNCVKEESTALTFQPRSLAGHAQVLAGESKYNYVDVPQILYLLLSNPGHVSKVRHIGVMVLQQAAGEVLDLGHSGAFPTKGEPRNRSCLDAAEEAEIPHLPAFLPRLKASMMR
jgi:hypothetical protein